MNQVVNRTAGSAVAALQSLSKGLSNVVATIPTSGGDPYLRMQTDGSWVYGQDNIEVEPQSEWAVNIFSFRHGYASWEDNEKDARGRQKKNEKVGEVMVSMQETKPLKTSLEDTGWEWADQVSVQLKCVKGEDKGEQILYSTTSKGGLNAIAKLIENVQKQLAADQAHPVPVVQLNSDHYPHPTYGKTWYPVLDIVAWASLDDENDVAEEEEPEKEPEPEPAKPTRQRRASTVPTTKPAETKQPDHETVAQAVETLAQRLRRELAEAEVAEEAERITREAPDVTRAASPAELASIRAAEQQAPAGQPEIRRRRRTA